jgi:hypothetical protein
MIRRFAPGGQEADLLGDDLVLATGVDTAPTMVAEQVVAIAAKHLASVAPRSVKDEFGQVATQTSVKLEGFEPQVIAGFPTLLSQPAAVDWVATSRTHQLRRSRSQNLSRPIWCYSTSKPVLGSAGMPYSRARPSSSSMR